MELGQRPGDLDEWANNVDETSAAIKGIIDGTITDFDEFDRQMELKERVKQIRAEELKEKKERFFAYGTEGKGEGTRYKWWCRRCFVEYLVDLPGNTCTRCKQSDKMITQAARREELLGKLEDFKKAKATHQFRKDKWLRWKKSQALLKRSKYINYKAWSYWEPDTDTEDEGDPVCPRDNPEFLAMEADMLQRKKKTFERNKTARKCRDRGTECMKEGDFVAALENYEEGLEYRRDDKYLWTNKALAEIKIFRWHDAIASCNKVIEYSEIFEEGFKKSADANFKAFTRRAQALRALHRWEEAVEDLQDACRLFPKDREARDLLEKTKAALAESKVVSGEVAPQEEDASTVDTADEAEAPAKTETEAPLRVAIIESDSEDEEEPRSKSTATGSAGSVAGLRPQEFDALLERLKRSETERMRFCSRGGRNSSNDRIKRDGRKLVFQVEEEVAPSGLDVVLKDIERCSVLWRKSQGNVVPLRSDVKQTITASEPEDLDRESAVFLEKATPRLLKVLHLLAVNSDHHCELSAGAVRHVWPLLSSETWQHSVLALLMEWSQRTVSAKSVAEFASRYPTPHLNLLVEHVTVESKQNMLPPGFEAKMKASAERMERGEMDINAALQDVLQGLSESSTTELAISTLGNVCLSGQNNPLFKEQLLPFCDKLVDALKGRLRAMDWRLCGRAAGALCNVVRLGDAYAASVQERCIGPILTALKDETAADSSASFLQSLKAQGASAGLPTTKATGRLLGALVNLAVVRPASAKTMLEHGGLEVVMPLIDPDAERGNVTDGADASGAEVSARAVLIVSRLVAASPEALVSHMEADLLCRLQRLLGRLGDFSAVRAAVQADGAAEEDMESLDLAVRLLTTVLVKTPGALKRMVDASSPCKIEELPDDYDTSAAARKSVPANMQSWGIIELVSCMLKLAKALQPRDYLGVDDERSALSRIRGNTALLFTTLAEAQAEDSASPVLRRLDLSPLVPIFIDTLRKERGKVQHNVGVCVTRLAQNQRYRELVRNLNGIETLHQVQLPRVNAEKEKAAKLHRLRGPQPSGPEISGLD